MIKFENDIYIFTIKYNYEQHFLLNRQTDTQEKKLQQNLAILKQQQLNMILHRQNADAEKTIIVVDLSVADFLFGILCILLFAWEIVMASLIISCGATSVCLLGNLGKHKFSFLQCRIIVPLYSAQLLLYCQFYLSQARFISLDLYASSYVRFHKNTLARISGKATLPRFAIYPQFFAKIKHNLRAISLSVVTAFAVCLLVGFIVCVISSGSIEFQHTWGWFGYVG